MADDELVSEKIGQKGAVLGDNMATSIEITRVVFEFGRFHAPIC